MRRRIQLAFALIGAAVALSTAVLQAAPASAATNPVIADCIAHGQLTKSYSISQLHLALSTLSAVTKEYTNCSDVINRALAAAVGTNPGSGTGSGGSGSFLPTPVIIILAILVLAAVSFGAVAVRRHRAGAVDPSAR